jgi:hypothetical protein
MQRSSPSRQTARVLSDGANTSFAAAIHDHLELKRRNAALEFDMPLENYLSGHARKSAKRIENDSWREEDEDTLPGVSWPQ